MRCDACAESLGMNAWVMQEVMGFVLMQGMAQMMRKVK